MEDTNQGGTAVADAVDQSAQPAEQSQTGGSGDWRDEGGPSEASKAFRDLLLSSGTQRVDLTSKPDEADATGGSTADDSADVKPGAPERGSDGRFVPRRGVRQALAEVDARAAEIDPAKLREQIRAEVLAEQQQQADAAKLTSLEQSKADDVARYRRLLETPDAELSSEDYTWREDFKERLRSLPEVEATHRELARQTVEAERTQLQQREQSFLQGQFQQIQRLGQRAGIDLDTWKDKTFEQMAEDVADAREAPLRARIRELEAELGQFRLTGPRGLAAARSGLSGGVSGGAPATSNNDLFRQLLQGGG